jgi:hypothetical protein
MMAVWRSSKQMKVARKNAIDVFQKQADPPPLSRIHPRAARPQPRRPLHRTSRLRNRHPHPESPHRLRQGVAQAGILRRRRQGRARSPARATPGTR